MAKTRRPPRQPVWPYLVTGGILWLIAAPGVQVASRLGILAEYGILVAVVLLLIGLWWKDQKGAVKVYRLGVREGKRVGREIGLSEGREVGWDEGFAKGESNGMTIGLSLAASKPTVGPRDAVVLVVSPDGSAAIAVSAVLQLMTGQPDSEDLHINSAGLRETVDKRPSGRGEESRQ